MNTVNINIENANPQNTANQQVVLGNVIEQCALLQAALGDMIATVENDNLTPQQQNDLYNQLRGARHSVKSITEQASQSMGVK